MSGHSKHAGNAFALVLCNSYDHHEYLSTLSGALSDGENVTARLQSHWGKLQLKKRTNMDAKKMEKVIKNFGRQVAECDRPLVRLRHALLCLAMGLQAAGFNTTFLQTGATPVNNDRLSANLCWPAMA
jgi:hypothetical protein